ncbi:serine/threonine-protein kinase [Fimbriiglobus ruber]|uniref:non-specific serine/threonine protein kinase n=1 Tax=Fimbriiglobus ruber TaxID=1908690 RepID=A0A225DX71_9BACT|nr:serine/threonine-protein kinase [Fimbriiglobus ruber]OWK45593.1 serine/threonine protein kinase [Fimbriiglobus ruber]
MAADPKRVKEIFLAAVEHPDTTSRAAFVGHSCAGDAELRDRVERLLRTHDTGGSFLGTPAAVIPDPDHVEMGSFAARAEPESVGGARGPASPDDGDDHSLFLAPSSRPDSLGRIGHYEVLQVLGRGGFGIVFRAFDDVLHRVVAVKVLAPHVAATSPARKRFLREARWSAAVRHENVVQVYEVGEQPLPYLVMEFIPGESLQALLDRTGPLEVSEVVQIGRQVAAGLAAAHAQGIVHRDIKPANILIESGPNRHVKITDFGLARSADDASLTQSGIIAGTPMFMSPEQAHGSPIDHRADLFSLGSVLYAMCTGRPPFRAAGTLAILKRVTEDAPRPIRDVIPEVPSWLCDIVARLHAKNPADRLATAREVVDLLARGADGAPSSDRVTPPQPAAKEAARSGFPIRRRGVVTVTLAVALILAAGLGLAKMAGVGISREPTAGDLPIPTPVADSLPVATPAAETAQPRKPVVAPQPAAAAAQTPKPALDPAAADAAVWEKSVAALPRAERARAVVARLQKLNPDFNREVNWPVVPGIDLALRGDAVRDLSPVRAMTDTHILIINAKNVTDLTPLRGMELARLDMWRTGVTDLSPLKEMATLRSLNMTGSLNVTDLAPLTGMELVDICIASTGVRDLTPLVGMPLKILNCHGAPVTDLKPIKDLPLRDLMIQVTQVSDLTPVKNMPLKKLIFYDSSVTDLTPLKNLQLEYVGLTPRNITLGLEILRGMTSIQVISVGFGKEWPAAEFWARYDKGEFKK